MKYSPSDYAKILFGLEKETDANIKTTVVKRIAKIMEEHKDLSLVNDIEESFKNLKLKIAGKQKIIIEYAEPINKSSILQKLERNYEVKFVENPKLKGGIKIKIGDKQIDNSLRQRLNNLQKIIA